jgi:predicted NAD/FAD-binding protein
VRFNRHSERLLEETDDRMGLGEVLDGEGVGEGFKQWYFVPMASAIWSTRPMDMLDFPAQTFLRFMDNHGLLQIIGHPDWKSVVGGSRNYVNALAGDVSGEIRTGAPVDRVARESGRVVVESATGESAYDAVVIGTHPGTTLGMLGDADDEEREILSAFKYQSNPTCVHCDERFLPTAKRAHAAWNYFAETGRIDSDHLSVTYYLNKLQRLGTEHPVLVTLNPLVSPAVEDVFFEIDYEHPVFDRPAIVAQRRIPDIQGRGGVYYTGAWQRYGFHEDGLWSAVRVAESLGVAVPWKEKAAASASAQAVASA